MKIAVFSTQPYDKKYFDRLNAEYGFELNYLNTHLDPHSASLTKDFDIICCFVNDILDKVVLTQLKANNIKLIALRSAGYNHVDLACAKKLGIPVCRVPAYSPYAVAEHAVGLILALNRKIHRAHNRIRESDFSLHGLMGFDLFGKTVGIIGTGKIGTRFAHIMAGFGCQLIAYDPEPNAECKKLGVNYVELDYLFTHADIISLHCPLSPKTEHLINQKTLGHMKPNVMIINTSRGAVIDTQSVINALKSGQVGYLGLDVYEEEGDLFFEDLSDRVITDDVFARLQTFPNVIVTGHQGFFTEEAVTNIAKITLENINKFLETGSADNLVT